MNKAHNAAKPQHLPQFVGYALVASHLDVSRRTVERMVREGKFPMPVQLTPNREGWKADIVEEGMDERTKRLVAHAVTHPDQLAPDEMAPTMQMLAVWLLEQEFDEAVRPDQVRLTLSRTATNDELASCRAKLLESTNPQPRYVIGVARPARVADLRGGARARRAALTLDRRDRGDPEPDPLFRQQHHGRAAATALHGRRGRQAHRNIAGACVPDRREGGVGRWAMRALSHLAVQECPVTGEGRR